MLSYRWNEEQQDWESIPLVTDADYRKRSAAERVEEEAREARKRAQWAAYYEDIERIRAEGWKAWKAEQQQLAIEEVESDEGELETHR